MELSSFLLSMLSKTKRNQDGIDEPKHELTISNDDGRSNKKKQKLDSPEKWTESDLERLIEVMDEYNCMLDGHICFYDNHPSNYLDIAHLLATVLPQLQHPSGMPLHQIFQIRLQ